MDRQVAFFYVNSKISYVSNAVRAFVIISGLVRFNE